MILFNNEPLKALRSERKLSRSDMVFELDKMGLRISRPTLINWEEGITEPRASEAYTLAQFFKVSFERFFKQSRKCA